MRSTRAKDFSARCQVVVALRSTRAKDLCATCQVVVAVRSTRAKDFSTRCQVVVALRSTRAKEFCARCQVVVAEKRADLRVPEEGSAVRSSEPSVPHLPGYVVTSLVQPMYKQTHCRLRSPVSSSSEPCAFRLPFDNV